MKEHDLAGPVAAWLEADGFTVYAEVEVLPMRRVDLVGRKGDALRLVELKRGWTAGLFGQCQPLRLVSPDVWGAASTVPNNRACATAAAMGVVMLRVDPDRVRVLQSPTASGLWDHGGGIHDDYWPDRARRIIGRALPGIGRAGRKCELGEGPACECAERVKAFIATRPGWTWRAVFDAVPNHYASPRSMAGALAWRVAGVPAGALLPPGFMRGTK